MPITTSSILRQAAAGAAVESSAVGSLRPQDVRRVLSTLSKKRRTDIGMWKAALTQYGGVVGRGSGEGAVEAMEARSNPSHLDVSYILHACTRSPKNVKEESAAVVSACLRRAMSRVDTFSCRSLAAIASSCVRLADERFPELVDGSEEMPAITEVFDCFAGALGKRHRPTQSKYRVKDVALLCHSFSKFPTALTIHVLFQQILREGILVTTEVDGEDDATMHVKDLAQILSACSRVSIRDSEVVAACARFVPGQCKYMDGQGLAIVWRALSRLMYSETATRVDEDGAPIEAAYDERSCYEALQSRLPMVIHQMSWQEVGMVAQAASRTRAHQLARDSDRAWAEVAKCLVHHAMTTLAPVCQPADAHSLTCLIYGVGLLSQLQRSDAASKSSRRLIQQQDTSGLGDLARKILWSSPPSSTVLRDISRTAAGLAALGLEPSHAFWHALETHSLPSENCETKNASLRLTDPSDIANATLALALATKRLPVEFSKSWLGEEGSWSFSALAAVVHACALSGSGGNDIVGELGRRVAAQTWELYSYGPGEGDNLAKTAVELWWLQGRLPGKLERYLREATRSMSTRARGVAEELLRQPEIRDREPSTAKKNRTVQTWTYWIAEDQNVTRATKLVVRSAPEASEAKMELSSFRDFIGVGCPPDVAAAARKMSDILGVPWDAYPIPLLRYPSPSGKVVNFIIVNQNGWVPSDLAVAAGCSGGQTSTVALVAEDAYKYHAIIKEVLKVC
ncbi:hypothetical protein FOL47_009502 [Perkinsus chesapeaki]|uniref:Uncharacterized protein n=1 Tax=Perkinsus chesapeaki TaxID=330153 RepID=A0A7J6L7V1_PERCH|nr:hypothetical protein FOL47_009502 [Perkinsus chesapeaki]